MSKQMGQSRQSGTENQYKQRGKRSSKVDILTFLTSSSGGAVRPADSPNFLGEGGAACLRGRMDYLNGGGWLHRVGLTFHAQCRRHPLGQRLRAFVAGIGLMCTVAQTCALHGHADSRVARAASPGKIARRIVVLVAVNVVHFHVSRRTAKCTNPRAYRPAFRRVRPVSRRAVSDLR